MSQRNKNSKSSNKKSRKTFRKGKGNVPLGRTLNDGVLSQQNALTRLPKSVSSIMPDRLFTTLKFFGYGNLSIIVGNQAIGARYRPTAAYDIDPALGSTATPGFSELAAFYSNYRVTTSKLVLEASNQSSAQGAMIVLCPLNADPGAAPSLGTVQSWIEQPYAEIKAMGTAGSPAVHIEKTISTEKIFGSKMVYFDDAFTSLVTTNPTNNWYWAIGAISPLAVAGSTLTVNTLIEIYIGIEFFSRKVLSS
jgi:hypothetical protein